MQICCHTGGFYRRHELLRELWRMESLQQLIPLLASAGGVWLQFSLRFGSGVLFILPDDLSDEK
jgi:hypothetical protein